MKSHLVNTFTEYLPGLVGGEVVVTGPLVGESVGSVTGADVVVGSTDPSPSPMKEQLNPF